MSNVLKKSVHSMFSQFFCPKVIELLKIVCEFAELWSAASSATPSVNLVSLAAVVPNFHISYCCIAHPWIFPLFSECSP